MHLGQRGHDRVHHIEHLRRRKPAAHLCQVAFQRLPLYVLHDDVGCRVFDEEVVDRHDSGQRAKFGEAFRLVYKTVAPFGKEIPLCAGKRLVQYNN